jgi:photosystem II stability/assembly factor-like uncharacterized protein
VKSIYLGLLIVLSAGCGDDLPPFVCTMDAQCNRMGVLGKCVTSSCASPAADCPSGYRYQDNAGDLAGKCVGVSDMGMGDMIDAAKPLPDLIGVDYIVSPIWKKKTIPTSGNEVTGIFGRAGTVYLVGTFRDNNNSSAVVATSDVGATWSTLSASPKATYELTAIWGPPTGADIWVVGNNAEIYHSTGGGFTAQTLPGASSPVLFTISGTSANDVYVAGGGGAPHIYRSTNAGAVWSDLNQANQFGADNLYGVGITTSTVFVIGDFSKGDIYSGSNPPSTFSLGTSYAKNVHAIWTVGSEAYVVGDGGLILHSTGGGSFADETFATAENLLAVFGTSASDVYAVGSGGIMVHSTGAGNWSLVPLPTSSTLQAVWASAPGDIWIGGQNSTLIHSE